MCESKLFKHENCANQPSLKEELEKDGPKRHGDSQSKSTPTLSNYIPFILYT